LDNILQQNNDTSNLKQINASIDNAGVALQSKLCTNGVISKLIDILFAQKDILDLSCIRTMRILAENHPEVRMELLTKRHTIISIFTSIFL
jgi:hypothetical protein